MKSIKLKILIFGLIVSAINVYSQQKYIMVDQFGYRPFDTKVAVLADPQIGFNASDTYIPGDYLEVKNARTHEVILKRTPTAFDNGKTDALSGDRGWWLNFTGLTEIGEYYIYDPKNNVSSYTFQIHPNVYYEALKASVRMFYYQRLAIPHEAKYSGEWVDDAAYLQDSVCRYVNDRDNEALFKDMRGGWMDAGDHNKYVTFVGNAIHLLLCTYTDYPELFTDDFNIPESGNGIPDLIDEILWEIEWVKRMQDTTDGGVHIKMGNINGDPIDYEKIVPSQDKRNRYYGPKCSSSSIYAAGMFAHMAVILKDFEGYDNYIEDLKRRSLKALEYYLKNPNQTNCDDRTIRAGDADRGAIHQERHLAITYLYLYLLTGSEVYHSTFIEKGKKLDLNISPYAEGLLQYAYHPMADKDFAKEILHKKKETKSRVDYINNKHLYRAGLPADSRYYYWGGNCHRANAGSLAYDFMLYGVDSINNRLYNETSLNLLHYFHGVNPLNLLYLTNMYEFGGDNCATEIYHNWFTNNTKWDDNPAPGYMPGGPNSGYTGVLSPPKNQPPDKSYAQFNEHGAPNNAWEITEPMCHYQAFYVRLVANFVSGGCEPEANILNVKSDTDSINIYVGETFYANCKVYPFEVCDKRLRWKSLDSTIVKVNPQGKIEALKDGKTQILITSVANNNISDTINVIVTNCERKTYSSNTPKLPGTIFAIEYDYSCPTNPSYSDNTHGNLGVLVRNDDVDIQNCSEGGYNIAWMNKGEWLEYTVDVQSPGKYKVNARISSGANGGKFVLAPPEGFPLSQITCPPTGGWQNWITVPAGCTLSPGEQTIRLTVTQGDVNIQKLDFWHLATSVSKIKQSENYKVQVYDIAGICKSEFETSGSNLKKYLQQTNNIDFKPGVYLFRISSKNETFTVKKILGSRLN